jgi:hypothetical protein
MRPQPLIGVLVLLGVDGAVGMPWWWSAAEGPGGVVFGAQLFMLARTVYLERWNSMLPSLCETCALMREVVTPKGSRFLLCQWSQTDPAYSKYPAQPVGRCRGYRKKEQTGGTVER